MFIETRVDDEQIGRHILHVDHILLRLGSMMNRWGDIYCMWIIYYWDSGRWWTDRETYTTCGSYIIETRVDDEQIAWHILHVNHILLRLGSMMNRWGDIYYMWIIYYLDSGRWWTDRETYTTCGSHIIETRVNDEQIGRHILHVDHIDGSRLGNHMFIVASFYGLANNSNCVPVINKNIDLPFPRIENKVTFRMVPASQNTTTIANYLQTFL